MRDWFTSDRERGASVVEMAFIVPLLVILAIGAAELGFAFIDWFDVSAATREGARVGASAGDDPAADTLILSVVNEALADLPYGEMTEVWIYDAAADGSVIDDVNLTNKYAPDGVGGFNCTNLCPWDPSLRETNPNLDLTRLGVKIFFDHDWVTGFLVWSGSASFEDETIMRLEPK